MIRNSGSPRGGTLSQLDAALSDYATATSLLRSFITCSHRVTKSETTKESSSVLVPAFPFSSMKSIFERNESSPMRVKEGLI